MYTVEKLETRLHMHLQLIEIYMLDFTILPYSTIYLHYPTTPEYVTAVDYTVCNCIRVKGLCSLSEYELDLGSQSRGEFTYQGSLGNPVAYDTSNKSPEFLIVSYTEECM